MPVANIHPTPTRHPRLAALVEEVTPELAAAGYAPHPGHPLWARDREHGLATLVLSYAPDDGEGGWVEPFVGLIDQRVETLLATYRNTAPTHGLRHTLLVGASRWAAAPLDRQPVHSDSEVLEVANELLRWWRAAAPLLLERFGSGLPALDALFNADHPEAERYLTHELYRALRGVAVRRCLDPADDLLDVVAFHRARMLNSGFWEVYGEQVRNFATMLT